MVYFIMGEISLLNLFLCAYIAETKNSIVIYHASLKCGQADSTEMCVFPGADIGSIIVLHANLCKSEILMQMPLTFLWSRCILNGQREEYV
jgi:hypothetical protein